MDTESAVQKLIEDQASPDNNIRRAGELQFSQLVQHDPSKICYILIQLAVDSNQAVDSRQAALLHLRRLVPKYWSMAFPSFTGTPIAQDLKLLIRSHLINLIISTDNSKLRNGGSYVIVQIAVADYPDEWPSLLSDLYEHTKDFSNPVAVKGALQVLNDLFDDLVTEEQFWNQGIGNQIIGHISLLLAQSSLDAATKINGLELYKSVLNYLTSPGAFSDGNNKDLVYDHIHKVCQLFYQLIQESINTTESQKNINTVQLIECKYRATIYSILSSLIGTFNRKIPGDFKKFLLLELFNDFGMLQNFYNQINNLNLLVNFVAVDNDLLKDITEFLNEIIGLMLLLQHSLPLASVLESHQYQVFMDQVIGITCLPVEDSYDNDFNTYITENTGLSGFVTVRDTINEFLSELNSTDSTHFFKYLASHINPSSSWEITESQFYMLESLCQNEDSDLSGAGINVTDLFQFILRSLSLDPSIATSFGNSGSPGASPSPSGTSSHHLIIGRVILMLPKLLEKFEPELRIDEMAIFSPHQAEYNNKLAAFTFSSSIFFCKQLDNSSESQFVKAAGIISCVNYRNLVEFEDDFVHTNSGLIQGTVFQIILDLLDESEEDTLPVLLEALSVGIDINHEFAGNYKLNDANSIIDLVLKISFKDPGNVQLVIESSDCLKTLLGNITLDNYIVCCEKSLPLIFDIINEAINNSDGEIEYSPNLDLCLELLNIIIESVPLSSNEEKVLPDQIFSYIYPVIKKLILLASDDQILQNGGSVFNSLLQNATNSFINYKDPNSGENGLQSLLTIVSKFLSPQLSDSAALNCGTIITSLINKFQLQLGDEFLSQILSATTQRLVIAKEVVTIENLVMLFCNLVLLSPEHMVDFLSNNIKLKDPKDNMEKSGLALILPIWFQSFEVTRGYEKIKQNALALGKIFSLTDKRIETLIVNGDIIPYEGDKIMTRSMTKTMPERYTQISASLKILKLLVGELDFQSQQPNAEDYLPENTTTDNIEGDDEGWEDLEDIGIPNYEKLKSYAESDDEEEGSSDEDLKNLLVHFFKECTSKNMGNFLSHYEQLDDGEKKVIAENVFF